MNLKIASAITVFLFFSSPAFSQSPSGMPEFDGEINAVVSGNVIPLERSRTSIGASVPIFSFSSKGWNEVPGAQSPIRFRTSDSIYFVIKTSQSTNPADVWQLTRVESKRKVRRLKSMTFGLSGMKDNRMENAVAVRFSRNGASGFTITPIAPLSVGEYAFSEAGGGLTFSLFGVDQ